jgi:hypothetical protein
MAIITIAKYIWALFCQALNTHEHVHMYTRPHTTLTTIEKYYMYGIHNLSSSILKDFIV